MAKYASPGETVKIRACFNSIPAQLAKENKKFQYKVVQRGGSATLFGESIDWLEQAGIVLKCQKIEQALSCNGHKPFYWTSNHLAELDFVVQNEKGIIGIEVKKGLKVHSKSLNEFIKKYSPYCSIRFSEKNFGSTDSIFSVPHYAAFCFEKENGPIPKD